MAIKINGNDLQKRFVGTTEIVRVYKAGYQVRPDTVPNYLCFEGTAGENTQIKLIKHGTAISTIYFEYSYNQTSWTDLQYDTYIDISNGAKVYIRNKNTSVTYITASSNDYFRFQANATYNIHIKASGDVTTLLCKEGTTTLPTNYCFYGLFYNFPITTAPTLPATTLTSHCYDSMFHGTKITVAPTLPATTLASYCYKSMFSGSGLTTAPTLSATTLTTFCYESMFEDCGSLTTAPSLPATTLATYCYGHMFDGCTSLTTAPSLPATTLADSCYRSMFDGCTSLTTTPTLSAMTMASECYALMFSNCTSLVTVPQLPATTLAYACYAGMFHGCTSLATLPYLPADILAEDCYATMFEECASIKLSETQTGEYQTPYSIDGVIYASATGALDGMFEDTGGTFTGTPTNFTTYYTSNTII